jgi:hypothetical protein
MLSPFSLSRSGEVFLSSIQAIHGMLANRRARLKNSSVAEHGRQARSLSMIEGMLMAVGAIGVWKQIKTGWLRIGST